MQFSVATNKIVPPSESVASHLFTILIITISLLVVYGWWGGEEREEEPGVLWWMERRLVFYEGTFRIHASSRGIRANNDRVGGGVIKTRAVSTTDLDAYVY